MERAKRLASLWSYLPVFRVVAETEHISRAAKRLFVTPSAVSRSLAALEADIGQPLFDRHGRSMKLNEAGQHLLLGIRSSMRAVDESLVAIAGEMLVGKVRISTSEPFSSTTLPRLIDELREHHPCLVPSIMRIPEAELGDALLDGRIDVAFARVAAPRQQLSSVTLCRFSTGAFVAAGHPLAQHAQPDRAALRAARYVETGAQDDAHASVWANELGLRVSLSVADFDLALAAVQASGSVAVLPEVMATADAGGGALRRLKLPPPPDLTMVARFRSPQERPSRADEVVATAARVVRATEECPSE